MDFGSLSPSLLFKLGFLKEQFITTAWVKFSGASLPGEAAGCSGAEAVQMAGERGSGFKGNETNKIISNKFCRGQT